MAWGLSKWLIEHKATLQESIGILFPYYIKVKNMLNTRASKLGLMLIPWTKPGQQWAAYYVYGERESNFQAIWKPFKHFATYDEAAAYVWWYNDCLIVMHQEKSKENLNENH